MVTPSSPHAPIVLDIFPDGLGIKQAQNPIKETDVQLALLQDTPAIARAQTEYAFYKGKCSDILESLSYSKQICLRDQVVVLGSTRDPFAPDSFDQALGILETLAHAGPRLLCVQTRSPLIVLALPVLKSLGDAVMVTIAFETLSNEVAQQYTPHYSRPDERFKAAQTLRRFGILTHAQVTSLTSERNLDRFIDRLTEVSEFISISEPPQQFARCAHGRVPPHKLASMISAREPKKLLASLAGLLSALAIDECDEESEASVAA